MSLLTNCKHGCWIVARPIPPPASPQEEAQHSRRIDYTWHHVAMFCTRSGAKPKASGSTSEEPSPLQAEGHKASVWSVWLFFGFWFGMPFWDFQCYQGGSMDYCCWCTRIEEDPGGRRDGHPASENLHARDQDSLILSCTCAWLSKNERKSHPAPSCTSHYFPTFVSCNLLQGQERQPLQ